MVKGAITAAVVLALSLAAQNTSQAPEWAMNASIIEACSCPMFCQCYFNSKPAEHSGHAGHGSGHFCKFNNAFRVNKGKFGSTALDGAKFWVSGDLGPDLAAEQFDWAVVTFDPGVKKEQRDGIATIMQHVYPFKWKSFQVADDAQMEWTYTKDRAEARLNGGKTAEVVLKRSAGMKDGPIVIQNLKYFGVPRNDGFIMMPNEVEAYRLGPKAFEYKGTNGFFITIDINSKDARIAGAKKM